MKIVLMVAAVLALGASYPGRTFIAPDNAAAGSTRLDVDTNMPMRHGRAVVDAADVMSEPARRALNARLVEYEHATGHQIAVATVPSLRGQSVEAFANTLAREWGLGDKHRNDGVLLLLAPNEHKIRIEVGYGLEPVLTDAESSRIVRDVIVPALHRTGASDALEAGAEAIITTIAEGKVVQASALHRNVLTDPRMYDWLLPILGTMAVLSLIAEYRIRRTGRTGSDRQRSETMPSENFGSTDQPMTVQPVLAPGYWPIRESILIGPGWAATAAVTVTRNNASDVATTGIGAAAATPGDTIDVTRDSPRHIDSGSPSYSSGTSADYGGAYDSGGGSFGGGGASGSY